MKRLWKLGLAIVAVLVLAGAAVAFVSAQTDTAVPGTDFVARLAEKLGISQDKLQAAIDETQLDMVDEAVAEGRLTDEQANRIRDRIESGEGLFPFGGFGKGFALGRGIGHLGASVNDVADFLGMSVDELRAAMADGQSLAQVADSQGVGADKLKEYLVGQVEESVAQAVKDGRITQTQADEILANAPDRIEQMINQEGSLCPWGGGRGHWRGGFGGPAEPEADDTTGTTF